MQRAITGFYEDVEGHFVAMLECGHEQHVRHKPPFIERPWVTSEEGRNAKIGALIECRACDAALETEAANNDEPRDP